MSWTWVSSAESTQWENVNKQSHFLVCTSITNLQFLNFEEHMCILYCWGISANNEILLKCAEADLGGPWPPGPVKTS